MSNVLKNVNAKTLQQKERNRHYYNKTRQQHTLEIGDHVLRKTNIQSDANKGIAASLAKLYEGPYLLSEKLGNNVFVLKDLQGKAAGRRNVDQLKKYTAPPTWAALSLQDAGDTDGPDEPTIETREEEPEEEEPTSVELPLGERQQEAKEKTNQKGDSIINKKPVVSSPVNYFNPKLTLPPIFPMYGLRRRNLLSKPTRFLN
jgi:hypothetical protein